MHFQLKLYSLPKRFRQLWENFNTPFYPIPDTTHIRDNQFLQTFTVHRLSPSGQPEGFRGQKHLKRWFSTFPHHLHAKTKFSFFSPLVTPSGQVIVASQGQKLFKTWFSTFPHHLHAKTKFSFFRPLVTAPGQVKWAGSGSGVEKKSKS